LGLIIRELFTFGSLKIRHVSPNNLKKAFPSPRPWNVYIAKTLLPLHQHFCRFYEEIRDQPVAETWHERLVYSHEELAWGQRSDWAFLGIWVLVAAFFMQFPDIFGISHDAYFPRNVSFIVLAGMGGLFAFQQRLGLSATWPALIAMLFSMIYINVVPMDQQSDAFVLACMHVPIFLWIFVGFLYVGGLNPAGPKGIEFLRFHGDLLVMVAVIALAGGFIYSPDN